MSFLLAFSFLLSPSFLTFSTIEVKCATEFPAPACLAASFNRTAWYYKGTIISSEIRAMSNLHNVRGTSSKVVLHFLFLVFFFTKSLFDSKAFSFYLKQLIHLLIYEYSTNQPFFYSFNFKRLLLVKWVLGQISILLEILDLGEIQSCLLKIQLWLDCMQHLM